MTVVNPWGSALPADHADVRLSSRTASARSTRTGWPDDRLESRQVAGFAGGARRHRPRCSPGAAAPTTRETPWSTPRGRGRCVLNQPTPVGDYRVVASNVTADEAGHRRGQRRPGRGWHGRRRRRGHASAASTFTLVDIDAGREATRRRAAAGRRSGSCPRRRDGSSCGVRGPAAALSDRRRFDGPQAPGNVGHRARAVGLSRMHSVDASRFRVGGSGCIGWFPPPRRLSVKATLRTAVRRTGATRPGAGVGAGRTTCGVVARRATNLDHAGRPG